MIASDLHELIKDPVIRGQYLAALRVRGKDVLVRDMTAAMDWLIEMAVKLEVAERERGDLEKVVDVCKKESARHREARQKAEAEIARRDAAAGEAVHLYREHNPCNGMKTDWIEIDSEQLAALKESTDPETAEFRTLHEAVLPAAAGEAVGYLFTSSEGNVVYSPCPWAVEGLTLQGPVYAAAPPAALPVVTDLAVELLTAALIDGADAKTALKLAAPGMGAQQQKVVELPERETEQVVGWGAWDAFDADATIAALDAANVKWEVKP